MGAWWLLLPLLLAAPAGAGKQPRGASRGGPAAAAAPARATRAGVEARLRGQEFSTAADWAAVGARVDEVLIEVAGDGRADLHLRGRAVTALGFLPTPAARAFLESTVQGKAGSAQAAERLLVRKAAVALGWLGGPGTPGRLGPLLEHADADVRLDAAIGLGLTRLGEAADLLRKRLPEETVPRVRQQIGRQLRVIEEALAANGRGGKGGGGAAGAAPVLPGNRGVPSPIPPPVPGSPAAPPRGQ